METIYALFGHSHSLTMFQMLARGILVFVFAVIILRTAGKKNFGKMSPADNVIMIMLGAILGRAVVGAAPLVSVIVTSFAIVLFHRLLSWISLHNTGFGDLMKGRKLSLFKDGQEILPI